VPRKPGTPVRKVMRYRKEKEVSKKKSAISVEEYKNVVTFKLQKATALTHFTK
jgi:hypothetical protein